MKATIKQFSLTKIFRQKNPEDGALLCRIRTATQTEADLKRLSQNVRRTPPHDATVLSVFNAEVNKINDLMLQQVRGEEHVFHETRTGSFKKGKRAKEYIYQPELTLRIGCRVLIRENGKYETPKREWDGIESRVVEYVNGDTAIYRGLDKHGKLILRLESGSRRTIRLAVSKVPDTRYVREVVKVEQTDDETGDTVLVEQVVSKQVSDGTYSQYPISLGYALTIHKSQGQTLNKVHIILPPAAWMKDKRVEGIVYVGLSRCTDLNNVTLSRPLEHTDIWAKKELDIPDGQQYELL
jgi:hypothetical protein